MILCLDIGNTHVVGGVYDDGELKLRFRRDARVRASSDEVGLFLRSVLRENGVNPATINQISLCSAVPDAVYSIRGACIKYFGFPPFVLKAGAKTGLKISYRNPAEVGADRIAGAMGAVDRYPQKNLVVVDFGTATTLDAINENKEYLGGVILPGLRISMESLESRTARLPTVEIVPRSQVLGRTTAGSIQSGLYFGTIGSLREIHTRLIEEAFEGGRAITIATGGFAGLFEGLGLFDAHLPDLVLEGLRSALLLNQEKS
jgi:type III pantothenate kinase